MIPKRPVFGGNKLSALRGDNLISADTHDDRSVVNLNRLDNVNLSINSTNIAELREISPLKLSNSSIKEPLALGPIQSISPLKQKPILNDIKKKSALADSLLLSESSMRISLEDKILVPNHNKLSIPGFVIEVQPEHQDTTNDSFISKAENGIRGNNEPFLGPEDVSAEPNMSKTQTPHDLYEDYVNDDDMRLDEVRPFTQENNNRMSSPEINNEYLPFTGSKVIDERSRTEAMRGLMNRSTASAGEEQVFYSSMKINIQREIQSISLQKELNQAVARAQIDKVESLFSNAGDIASLIYSRDENGRTLMHLACLSKSAKIISYLYRQVIRQLDIKLQQELKLLQEDRHACHIIFHKKNRVEMKSKQSKPYQRWQIIEGWYDEEKYRLQRRHDFALENWYLQIMSIRDDDGRSPLHYAISCQAQSQLVETMLSFPHPTALSPDTIYDIWTGHIVATTNPTKHLASSKHTIDLNQSIDSNLVCTSISSSTWEIGSDAVRARPKMNYEIMIPWVLRNVMKRCKDKISQSKQGSKDEMRYFEDLIEEVDDSRSGLLLVAEVKMLLLRLDIRVTTDIIRELCSRYPSNSDTTIYKFKNMKDNHDETLARSKSRSDDDHRRRDDMHLEHRVRHNADAKHHRGDNMHQIRFDDVDDGVKMNTYMRSDDKSSKQRSRYQYDDTNDDSKFADSKRSKPGSGSFRPSYDIDSLADSKRQPFDGNDHMMDSYHSEMMSFDKGDESIGADIETLLADMRTGRAFKGLDVDGIFTKRTMHKSSIENHMIILPEDDVVRLPSLSSTQTIRKHRMDIMNHIDMYGRSALCLAGALNQGDIMKVLLAYGANVTLSTTNGSNAFNLSSEKSIHNLLEIHLVKWLNQKQHNRHDAINHNTTQRLANDRNHDDNSASADSFLSLLPQMQTLQQKHWSYSRSPLSWAITSGHIESVKIMIAKGVDLNSRDITGRSALHECASICRLADSIHIVQAVLVISEDLMNSGIQANILSISGRNALHELFCMNQDEAVRYAYLAEYRTSYTRTTLSQSAIGDNNEEMNLHDDISELIYWKSIFVRNLIGWGTNALSYDRHGLTPLHYCSRENMSECLVEILTTPIPSKISSSKDYHDVDGDKQRYVDARVRSMVSGNSPLHVACLSGSMDAAHILLRWDADYSIDDGLRGMKNQQGKLAKQLLQPTSKSTDKMDTIWMAAKDGSKDRILRILYHQKHLQISNHMNNTSSHIVEFDKLDLTKTDTMNTLHASSSYHTSAKMVVSWLDTSVDAKSRYMRWTAIHMCVIGWAEQAATSSNKCAQVALPDITRINNPTISKKSYPSKVDTKQKLKTSKLRDRSSGKDIEYSNTLTYLIKQQAFVDSFDVNGRSPLMIAAACNLVEASKMLIDAGASRDTIDNNGVSIIDYVLKYGCVSVSLILEDGKSSREYDDDHDRY